MGPGSESTHSGGWRPTKYKTKKQQFQSYMSPAATTWVSMGARVPLLSPNDHPNASQRQQKDFAKSFQTFSDATKQPINSNFRAFKGAHCSGYMGLAATVWVPMGARIPVLSPNNHPNPSQRRQEVFGKSQIFEIFRPTHASKSSPVGPMGGATGVTQSLDPRPLPLGVHVQEKSCSRPEPKSTHSSHNTQKYFD